jgi:hypothetical protein
MEEGQMMCGIRSDGITWGKTEKDPEWLGREDHAVLAFKIIFMCLQDGFRLEMDE